MPSRNRVRFACVGALCAALTLAGIDASSRARASSGIVRVPTSIDATGKTDVSTKMAAFFHSVPDGSTVMFKAGSRYRMDQTLVLDHRHRLTLEGNGATFIERTPGDAHRTNVRIVLSSDIVIRHVTVVGANPHAGTSEAAYVPAKEHQHGFELLGASHVTLDGVAAFDVYGDFVYLGGKGRVWSNDVVVRNSWFARNGRQGIALTGARNILIEHNSISEVRRATFDFEPDGAGSGVDHVVIRNNTVGRGRLLFVAAAGLQPVNHVQIRGNQLHGQSLQMAIRNDHRHYRDDWQIIGNTSDYALGSLTGTAMRIWHVDGLQIVNNVQPFQKGRHMVLAKINYSCHVSVRGNVLSNSVGVFQSAAGC